MQIDLHVQVQRMLAGPMGPTYGERRIEYRRRDCINNRKDERRLIKEV